MYWRNRLHCSFCRKGEREVSRLVAGPKVYICDECVELAKYIMDDASSTDVESMTRGRLVWRGLLKSVLNYGLQ